MSDPHAGGRLTAVCLSHAADFLSLGGVHSLDSELHTPPSPSLLLLAVCGRYVARPVGAPSLAELPPELGACCATECARDVGANVVIDFSSVLVCVVGCSAGADSPLSCGSGSDIRKQHMDLQAASGRGYLEKNKEEREGFICDHVLLMAYYTSGSCL